MKVPQTVDGQPCLAGTNIVAKGFASVAAGQAMGGLLGAAVASAGQRGPQVSPLKNGEKGYLALTSTELLLMSLGGMMVLKPKDVKLRIPRSDIASIELGEGKMFLPLTLRLVDGTTWAVDIPKVAVSNAQDLVATLQAGSKAA